MSDQESEDQETPLVTPEIFHRVMRGKGTAAEERAVREALRDPNSELLDWLEAVEAWAQKAFRRPSRHSEHADQILSEAIARKYRDDVIAFVQKKHSGGLFSDDDFAKIMAPVAVEEGPNATLSPLTVLTSVNDMLDIMVAVRPDLEPEARILRASSRARPGNERK